MNYSTLIFFSIVVGLLRVLLILFSGDPADHQASDAGDHYVYHLVAQMLTRDPSSWFNPGGEVGYRAPGYFIYLSGVYSLLPNASFQIGQIATAIVGVLNCVLVFFLVNNTVQNKSASLSF